MFDLIGSHLFTARVEMFLLEMKVEGFFTIDNDGKKKSEESGQAYQVGCASRSAYIIYIAKNSIQWEVKWSSNQNDRVLFYDKWLDEDVKLVHERNIVSLFQMYKSKMHCK